MIKILSGNGFWAMLFVSKMIIYLVASKYFPDVDADSAFVRKFLQGSSLYSIKFVHFHTSHYSRISLEDVIPYIRESEGNYLLEFQASKADIGLVLLHAKRNLRRIYSLIL